MKKLNLKNEYKGLVITRAIIGVGNVTFDSTKATPEQFTNYSKMGFEDLFEQVEECDNCKNHTCNCTDSKVVKYQGIPPKKKNRDERV